MENKESRQCIISVSREYGSGGHEIAEILAERFGMPLYDQSLLHEVSTQTNLDLEYLKKHDEKPKNLLLSRRVNGMSNSPEENVAQMQFETLRQHAADGESFVVVGRCADEILKENPNMVTFFILGDREAKVERTMEIYQIAEDEAESLILHNDRKRKMYHNSYCKGKWGDSRCYDLCINSSRLGVRATAEYLEAYVRKWMER